MIFQLVRRLHTSPIFQAVESSLLAKLRKKTGYTIANCKKALEMHNNDADKAEAWLNDQAQAMGWAKATKLAGRATQQGLVAVKFDKNHGALVELNCETDFVAKNEKFHKMIEEATVACYKFAHTHLKSKASITKILVALSFYATGSYQRLVGATHGTMMSQQSVSRAIQEVTEALNNEVIVKKWLKFPQTRQERDSIKQRFYEKYKIPSVIGAIDGTHVAIIRPSANEERFYNRKGFHSRNVLIMELDSEQLGNLTTEGGKKLSEVLALFIGTVGENAILRRAACWSANSDDVRISAYTHPAPATATDYSAGKYGALLAYSQEPGHDDVARQICQHIVGLAPTKIGDKQEDKPAANSDDETCLIFQEYLLDPEYKVEEVLEQNKIKIIDYIRFSCGETVEDKLPGVEKQPLDTVQTLQ